jgi:hypothetical protein
MHTHTHSPNPIPKHGIPLYNIQNLSPKGLTKDGQVQDPITIPQPRGMKLGSGSLDLFKARQVLSSPSVLHNLLEMLSLGRKLKVVSHSIICEVKIDLSHIQIGPLIVL